MIAMHSIGTRIRPRRRAGKLPCSLASLALVPDTSGAAPKHRRSTPHGPSDDVSMTSYCERRRRSALDTRQKMYSRSSSFSSRSPPQSCVGGSAIRWYAKHRLATMPQRLLQQRRGIFSSFSDSDKKTAFDPLRQSSAHVLKQPNEDLSEQEQKLKEALRQYADYVATTDDPTNHELLAQRDFDYEERLEAVQKVYMDMGYWSEALGIEETKCASWLEEGTDEYADSIHAQGKLWLRQEDFDHSKALYDQALEFYEASEHYEVQVGHVLISLAGWHYFQNRLDVAMEHLVKAEPMLDSNPPLLVKCLDNQGLVHRLWGDYHAALDKYQQALQVVGSGNNNKEQEGTRRALLMHLGDMYQAIEEPQEALQVYHDLVREMEEAGAADGDGDSAMKGMQGVLWHNIATIHVDFGDYESALDEFYRAIKLKTEMGGANHPEVAKTWNSLGVLHAGALRQLPKARECFQHALMIARINAKDSSTDEDVIHILQNISYIEQQLNR